jgi:hypothetical protein
LIVAEVLCIGDDESNVEFIGRVMRMGGRELEWAADSEQGQVLAKPFDLAQLRGAIRRCLGEQP